LTVRTTVPATGAPLVSMRRLEALLGRSRMDIERIATRAGRYYKPFDQRRPGDKKWRHIDSPTEELKRLQSRISSAILEDIPLPETMVGAVKDRSIRDNARRHIGNPFVVTLDLKHCFPRTHDLSVFRVFRERVGCSPRLARILTKLTTCQHRLPQGAPTSSMLANLALLPLHDAIQDALRDRGVTCTFWVDDIALSGDGALDVIPMVIEIIQKHGRAIRNRKLRIMPAHRSQAVTGATVNRKVSAPREFRARVRASIRAARLADVVTREDIQRIRGQIGHIAFLAPTQAKPLEVLAADLEELLIVDGPSSARMERRPCRSARRHRFE